MGRKKDSKAHSFGLNIVLPKEQNNNRFLDIKRDFHVFSQRLDGFMLLSNLVVIAPGGVGTTLEFFYAWQLMQVRHTCKIPIIMMGEMWKGLLEWIKDNPLEKGLLNKEDLDPIICVKDWEDVAKLVEEAYLVFKKSGPEACINLKSYAKRADINKIL